MNLHPLAVYTPIADAVARLLHPHAEVVIHDILADTVFHIANAFSSRSAGDRSLLKLDNHSFDDHEAVIGPYEKAGERGQRIRAVTSVLRDYQGKAVGIMCINLDYSMIEPALDILERLVRPPQAENHPEILFQNDWRDQIKLEIRRFLQENDLALDRMTPKERRRMIRRLDSRGLFYARKSIEQLARMLGVSRATAYNDLSRARGRGREKKGRVADTLVRRRLP